VAMAKKVPAEMPMAKTTCSGASERKNKKASRAPMGVVREKSKLRMATLRRFHPAASRIEEMDMLSGIL
jgi:hypothetical protein